MANDTRVQKVVMVTFYTRMRRGALKVSLSRGAQRLNIGGNVIDIQEEEQLLVAHNIQL